MISMFELLEKRNQYMRSKAEIIRTKLQYSLQKKSDTILSGRNIFVIKINYKIKMKQIDYNGMDTKIEKKIQIFKENDLYYNWFNYYSFGGIMDNISCQFILYECRQRWYNNFYCTKGRI